MTSQQWLTDDDFAPDSETKSIWWHILVIIVPDQVRFKNNASLYITGVGRSLIKFNDSDDITMNTYLACATKSIYGVLFQVFNASPTGMRIFVFGSYYANFKRFLTLSCVR